ERFIQARAVSNAELAIDDRQSKILSALRLLGRGPTQAQEDLDRLAHFLQPQFPLGVQRAALTGLRRARGRHVAEVLLAGWRSSSPTLRADILDILFARPEWLEPLLVAIEEGQIPAGQLG